MGEFKGLKDLINKRSGMGDAKVEDVPFDRLVRQLSVDDHIKNNYPTYSNLVQDTAGADFRNDPPVIPMKEDLFGKQVEDTSRARVYPKDEILHKALETTDAYNSETEPDDKFKNANRMLEARSKLQTGSANALTQDILSKDPLFKKAQSSFPLVKENWAKFYDNSSNDPRPLGNYIQQDKVLNPSGKEVPHIRNVSGRWNAGGHYSPDDNEIVMYPEVKEDFPSYLGTLIHEINHKQQNDNNVEDGHSTPRYIDSKHVENFIANQDPDNWRAQSAKEENGKYFPPRAGGVFNTSNSDEQQKIIDDAMKANDPKLFQRFFEGHDGSYDNATFRKSMEKLYSELPKQGFIQKPISEQPDLQKAAALEQIIKDLNKKNFKNKEK